MSRPLAVIIEGPDGAGKTTLAEQIQGALDIPGRYHMGPPPEDSSAYAQCHAFLDRMHALGEPFIADRLHIGERVYGPVHRGVDTLGEEGQRSVEGRLLRLFRPVLVICLPPWPVVQGNWRANIKLQMLQEEQELLEVWECYSEVLTRGKTHLPTLRYDFTRDSLTGVLRRLEEA